MLWQSQRSGNSISSVKLNSDDGAEYVVNAIHKMYQLLAVPEVLNDLNALLSTLRHNSEISKNFEFRFRAQLSRFNSHGTDGSQE